MNISCQVEKKEHQARVTSNYKERKCSLFFCAFALSFFISSYLVISNLGSVQVSIEVFTDPSHQVFFSFALLAVSKDHALQGADLGEGCRACTPLPLRWPVAFLLTSIVHNKKEKPIVHLHWSKTWGTVKKCLLHAIGMVVWHCSF